MVCQMILLAIVVHNSSQCFGSTCSNFSTFQLSFLQAIIPKQMAKLSVPTKHWNNIFIVSSTINKMIGLIICIWRNSLTTTTHSSTGYSAFFANTGCHPRWTINAHPDVPTNPTAEDLLSRLQNVRATILHNLHKAQVTHKRLADRHRLDSSKKVPRWGSCMASPTQYQDHSTLQ